MTATIDFGIKPALHFLMKDYRWNVLTVMFLHANIRNRCYMSMDTISEMATNGNRTKANRAKKWLEQHGAFELVPIDKRVDDEEKLTARQLVYQLTGKIVACLNPECDCKADGKEYLYLYFGKPNRLNGQTIPPDNRLNGDTGDRLNGQTQDSITIQTLSISSEVSLSEVKESPKGDMPSKGKGKSEVNVKIDAIICGYIKGLTTPPAANQYGNPNRTHAKALVMAGFTPDQVTEYTRVVQKQDYWNGKKPGLRNIADGIAAYFAGKPPIVIPDKPLEIVPPPPADDPVIDHSAEGQRIMDELKAKTNGNEIPHDWRADIAEALKKVSA